MSLDTEQIAQTSEELRANVALSGLTAPALAARIGISASRVERALDVVGSRPEDVWAVRDHLVAVLSRAGVEPVPFTTLTDEVRVVAENWFALRRAPSC